MRRRIMIGFLVILGLISGVGLAHAAEEGALIRDAILKYDPGLKNIQVYTIKTSNQWSLATFTHDDENLGTRGGSALLNRTGNQWQVLQFSGRTPTSDLLKQNNVPANLWEKLLDEAVVAKTKPALDFLHGKYPKLSFESVEISGDYVLAVWYGGEEAGMVLLRASGNSWKIALFTGGVIDGNSMRQYKVPEKNIRPLLGVQ